MPRTSLVLLLAVIGSAVASCERADRYHTRGLVQEVAKDGDEVSIAVHHERIAAFRDRDGKTAPMHSMVMIFGMAQALAPTLPTRGDKLAFDFEVRWDERPALRITRFERLPAETALQLAPEH